VAGEDRLVDNAATLAFAEAAPGAVTMRRYEALFHELFLEPEWPQVVADLCAWLCAPAPAEEKATSEVPAILQARP
jgi:alpha-beta hydrolase superfamily lysophospholipase